MSSNDPDRAFRRAAFDTITHEALKREQRESIAAAEYSPADVVDVDFTELAREVPQVKSHEVPLHPHQLAAMDEMRKLAAKHPVTIVTANDRDYLRSRSFDAVYGGRLREDHMIVLDHKTRDSDPDQAEPIIEQPKKRSASPSLMMASMVAMVAGTAPHLRLLDDPFAALERRVLSREEALEAFKTTDADKARIAAAEAKRARKAAKLKRG